MYQYFDYCLNLAQKYYCKTNPQVGAVIVYNGKIIASGYHRGPGSNHAEIEALANLKQKINPEMAMFVSLEPCNHVGKTNPCTHAIIQSGIKNVFYAVSDNNPDVSGAGHAYLKQNGVNASHINHRSSYLFYQPYLRWNKHRKPWFHLKQAQTINNVIGIENERLFITGHQANAWTMRERLKSDALVVSARTILTDDPKLTVRMDGKELLKPLIVIGRNLDMSNFSQYKNRPIHLIVNIDDLEATCIKHNYRQLLVECGAEMGSLLIQKRIINQISILRSTKTIKNEGAIFGITPSDRAFNKVSLTSLGNDYLESYFSTI